jgi:integrase
MIKSLIRYLKKKQVIYQGFTITNLPENAELRIMSKLLFSSGLSLEEIKYLKWENITVLDNILLLNYENKTKIAIASEYVMIELLKLKHTNEYVFPEYKKIETETLIKTINKQLLLAGIESGINKKICSNWLENNFINTVYIPKDSELLFEKHIINKIPIITTLNKKEFTKLLEIKSLL